MFTAVRPKALEHAPLVKTAQSASEMREVIPASSEQVNDRNAVAAEEEQMLSCLGAAVIMHWGTLPAKIRRELFECATSIRDVQEES